MSTVICKNKLCGKEFHSSFDTCPFCGTPNTATDEEIKHTLDVAATKESEPVGLIDFNGWITGILWISIFLGGARGVIKSVVYFIDPFMSPIAGVIQLALTAISIILLVFIINGKKWALITWFAFKLLVGILSGAADPNHDYITYLIVNALHCGLMILLLQLRKNGVSAWSLIFKKQPKQEK